MVRCRGTKNQQTDTRSHDRQPGGRNPLHLELTSSFTTRANCSARPRTEVMHVGNQVFFLRKNRNFYRKTYGKARGVLANELSSECVYYTVHNDGIALWASSGTAQRHGRCPMGEQARFMLS